MSDSDPGRDADKRLAAEAAVAEVRAGMLVGLGTGSTAGYAIRAIGRAGLAIEAVATSVASAELARSVGIRMVDFAGVSRVDLTIDGADEIDAGFRAIKGAGGAMLREKVVASASHRMIVIADGAKHVAAIGSAAVPVEVLPFARSFVERRLRGLMRSVAWRGRYVTDNGNPVIDCIVGAYGDWPALAAAIAAIPGVIGHGLFLDEVDAAYIAQNGVVTRLERAGATR